MPKVYVNSFKKHYYIYLKLLKGVKLRVNLKSNTILCEKTTQFYSNLTDFK
jgi:hypothetical protein